MARRANVPAQLRQAPFTIDEARRAGVPSSRLRGSSWRHLGYGLYAWSGLDLTPLVVLAAIQRQLPGNAYFSGRTAGWLHGFETPPLEPVEVTVPDESPLTPRKVVSIRRAALRLEDRCVVRGIRVTSVPRTLLDLTPRLTLVEGVVAVDSAYRLGPVTPAELDVWIAARPGVKGIRALRAAAGLADPRAESPMETRLRLALVLQGLPPPVPHSELSDSSGRQIARVDLYYPAARLAIEYDGGVHRDTLVADNRRQNDLLVAGYRLLRFTVADMRTPEAVAARVRAELLRAKAA